MDFMIDLETAGLGTECAILQIGAVGFNKMEASEPFTLFQKHVSLDSNLALGRTLDPDTIIWWMTQSDDARAAFVNGQKEAIALADALIELQDFVQRKGMNRAVLGQGRREPDSVWSHGAPFDLPRLFSAYAMIRLELPWSYKRERDTRTLFELTGRDMSELIDLSHVPPLEQEIATHHALTDSIQQAKAVIGAYQVLRGDHNEPQ